MRGRPAVGLPKGVARRLATTVVGLAAATAGAAQDAAPEPAVWQLELHSKRHSDALRLAVFDRDAWDEVAPRRGRNLVYIDDGLRLSRRQGAWTWAAVARSSATLVAGEAALRLAADVATGRQPATDLATDVDLRLRGFSGAGLAFGRTHAPAAGWQLQWEVQALALGRWIERRLAGDVRYQAADARYGFALQSLELDNRLDFPFRLGYARRGAGLLLAGSLAWDGQGAWARAGLHDGGWLRWRGVPQQDAVLNTSTQAVDADGFLIYRPLIEGQNRQTGRTRSQPWRGTLAAGATLRDGQRLGLHLDHVPQFGWLPALGWQRPAAVPGGLSLGARWQVHERRLGLTLDWRGFTLRAGADRLDGQARSRELALSYASAF
ncbi:MAG: hypothetical protein C0505_01630 [Leptothrix sp. (in: Bacteria)]|nr:hypothetical protein [Leptothrix sp. (in: b-proteobacteria)]